MEGHIERFITKKISKNRKVTKQVEDNKITNTSLNHSTVKYKLNFSVISKLAV